MFSDLKYQWLVDKLKESVPKVNIANLATDDQIVTSKELWLR